MSFAHAWIGYDNLFEKFSSGITASAFAAGFEPINVGNWYTWQRWQSAGASPWTIQVDCQTGKPVDYCAIAGHTLGGEVVKFQGSNNGTDWIDVVALSGPGNLFSGGTYFDSNTQFSGSNQFNTLIVNELNLAASFTQVSYRFYRFHITGTSTPPAIGVLACGKRMLFERGFYGGFLRPVWNEEVEVTNNESERGVFLGRSVIRIGNRPFGFKVEPVTHAWVDTVWSPFKLHADTKPFFFVWGTSALNLADVVFAWRAQWDPSTLKNTRHASVGMQCRGVLR